MCLTNSLAWVLKSVAYQAFLLQAPQGSQSPSDPPRDIKVSRRDPPLQVSFHQAANSHLL